MDIAWKQSRYNKGDGDDYINCPLTKDEYYNLIENIKTLSKKVSLKILKTISILKHVYQSKK